MNLEAAESYILEKLSSDLSKSLYYHGPHHTIDVVQAALQLAEQEKIDDQESLTLLKTAAFYHDSGFMHVYQNHEEEGCRIAREKLPKFRYNPKQIDAICEMIMATKIPQSPKTHLEQILCDADLDYLGRTDYEPIAQTLFSELLERGKISNAQQWNEIQINFLTAHKYWTASARKNRNCLKENQLKRLIETSN